MHLRDEVSMALMASLSVALAVSLALELSRASDCA
jgi:hypothetical protein